MTQVHSAKFEFVKESGLTVEALRHVNPDGSIGGWVAVDANVEKGAYVEVGAVVPPGAHVGSNERIVAEEVLAIEPL